MGAVITGSSAFADDDNRVVTSMPGLMEGKRGLVMGVANDHSIAWGIAKTLADHGAKLAFTYQGEALGQAREAARRVGRLDIRDAVRRRGHRLGRRGVRRRSAKQWGTIDFLVHAIAFSDKNELKGRYADTTRENFIRTMVISCFSFTEAAKRAAALMPNGGAMVTLTYNGGLRAMPNYNVMGVAKAGAGSLGALSRGRFRAAEDPRQRDLGRARSARSPAPASPMRAICSRSSRNIRRSAAA